VSCEDGFWKKASASCTYGCDSGKCKNPECSNNGQNRCSSNYDYVETCTNGFWVKSQYCTNGCLSSTNTCLPDEQRECIDGNLQIRTSDGNYYVVDCYGNGCRDGHCLTACTQGIGYCSEGNAVVCKDGDWTITLCDEKACKLAEFVTDNATLTTAQCITTPSGPCEPGTASICLNNVLYSCDRNPDTYPEDPEQYTWNRTECYNSSNYYNSMNCITLQDNTQTCAYSSCREGDGYDYYDERQEGEIYNISCEPNRRLRYTQCERDKRGYLVGAIRYANSLCDGQDSVMYCDYYNLNHATCPSCTKASSENDVTCSVSEQSCDYYDCSRQHGYACLNQFGIETALCNKDGYICARPIERQCFYGSGYLRYYYDDYPVQYGGTAYTYTEEVCIVVQDDPTCMSGTLTEPEIQTDSCNLRYDHTVAVYGICDEGEGGYDSKIGCETKLCKTYGEHAIVDYLVCTQNPHGNMWVPATSTSSKGVYKVCIGGCNEDGTDCDENGGWLTTYSTNE
jgi:hypothetical protein